MVFILFLDKQHIYFYTTLQTYYLESITFLIKHDFKILIMEPCYLIMEQFHNHYFDDVPYYCHYKIEVMTMFQK